MEMNVDYLVIGGGLSGLICARQLSRKFGPENVLVVEKGSPVSAEKKHSGAAFFAHRHMDEITDPHPVKTVWTIRGWWGTEKNAVRAYRKKIWNDFIGPEVSISEGVHNGYEINYEHLINTARILNNCEVKSVCVDKKRMVETNLGTIIVNRAIIITVPLFAWAKWFPEFPDSPEFDYSYKPIYLYDGKGIDQMNGNMVPGDKTIHMAYYPSYEDDWYRVTVSGSGVVAESLQNTIRLTSGSSTWNISPFGRKVPGKIHPLFGDCQAQFDIFKNKAINMDVYFIGRYAKWIPKYYIHDSYEDVNNLIDLRLWRMR